MQKLRTVSGDSLTFTGYGGPWMKKEGLNPTAEFDIDMMLDKTFHTYRKTKAFNETIFFKWNPFNLINKHYTRSTNHAMDLVSSKLVSCSADVRKQPSIKDSLIEAISHFEHRQ
jgi:hypothetical protein